MMKGRIAASGGQRILQSSHQLFGHFERPADAHVTEGQLLQEVPQKVSELGCARKTDALKNAPRSKIKFAVSLFRKVESMSSQMEAVLKARGWLSELTRIISCKTFVGEKTVFFMKRRIFLGVGVGGADHAKFHILEINS